MKQTKKQELLWIPKGKDVGAFALKCEVPYTGERPSRVWTLIGPTQESERPSLPIVPRHNVNAFVEDEIHDWNIRNGVFRYASRVSEGSVWLLLEFT